MKKLFCLFFSCLFLLGSLSLGVHAEEPITAENWMKSLDDSKSISSIALPGTHDSATKHVALSLFSKCQSLSISEQLNVGVRFLDIRLESDEDGFLLVHGISDCRKSRGLFAEKLRIEDVLEDCYNFLDENQSETIIFSLKEDDGNAGNDFYDKFYREYVDTEHWYVRNEVPKLGDVRGKIVLLRRCGIDASKYNDSNSGLNFDNWRDQGDDKTTFETDHIFSLSHEIIGVHNIQDRYKLLPMDKWKAILDMLESDRSNDDEFNLNFLSTSYIPFPIINAIIINFLFGRYESSKDVKGILILDFINKDLCEKIYSLNFDSI